MVWLQLIHGNSAPTGTTAAASTTGCRVTRCAIEIDGTPDPLPVLGSSAQAAGFRLRDDTERIDNLKGLPGPRGPDTFNPTSNYLFATRGGASLSVTITRSGTAPLDCWSADTYGKPPPTASPDRAIAHLSINLPSVE